MRNATYLPFLIPMQSHCEILRRFTFLASEGFTYPEKLSYIRDLSRFQILGVKLERIWHNKCILGWAAVTIIASHGLTKALLIRGTGITTNT